MTFYNQKINLKCFRADYWKSQDRKYCDFCKCWMSDNKASVEFHEKGKKHKDNVAKRLKAITKKSIQDNRKMAKMDDAIARMEQAGMEAYQKDLENNAGDIMGQTIKETLEKNNLAVKKRTPWYETKTVEGKIYYWNSETNESIWDVPEVGFLTIKEQQELADKEGRKQLKAIDKQRIIEARQQAEEEKQLAEEQRAAEQRERLKLLRPVELPEEQPPLFAPILPEGKTNPYGQWKTVESTNSKEVDYQLPQQEYVAIHVPEPHEAIQRTFKEKTAKLDKDDETSETGFKKRKFGGGQKRNMRQRLDVD